MILSVTTVFQQWIQVTYDQIGDLNFKYPQMLDFGVLIFFVVLFVWYFENTFNSFCREITA